MLMIFLIYLVLSVIVFLGLFIGLLISYLAEEELKPGMQYFDWLRHLIFVVILVLFFVKNPSWLLIIIIALLIIIFSLSRHRETLYYYALAIISFLSWRYNGFVLITPLIFLYGVVLGSIYLYNHVREKKKKIVLGLLYKYAGFLINSILLGILGLFF
jgi:hypothetical protein